jgi:hypothetical protein
MDAITFDRLVAEAARRPTRRATLRLLAGGLVAALLPARGAAAQRPDRDGDGLFDDDEVNVYGTNPDVFDTDGDGVGDGEEIYNRDQGLAGPNDPLTAGAPAVQPPDEPAAQPPAAGPCPAGQAECGAGCIDIMSDPFNCGACNSICDLVVGPICENGACTGSTAPTFCLEVGARCSVDWECCNPSQIINKCCFNGTMLDTICTTTYGGCPEFVTNPPPYAGCPYPQSQCDGVNCVDTWTNPSHCGGCYISCPLGGVCREGACVAL